MSSSGNLRLAVITNFPSYHQVDLFNALCAQPGIDLMVFYLRHITPGRQWSTLREIRHPHQFIRELRWHRHFYLSPGLARAVDAFQPDLQIITQYASIGMQWMMYRAHLKRQKWLYWSEPPGVRYTDLPIFASERLRRAFRKVALWPLRLAGPCEVWGIGQRAVEGYSRVTSAPVRNIPYYSDQEAFRATERGPIAYPVRFLFAGKLVSHKGFDRVVDAIELLAKRRNDFELVVIGDGPDLSFTDRLSEKARGLVRYEGFKQLAEVPEVFARCDALLFPSRYDGWGMALVEAMAAGMAVISTREAGSARDMIEHGENGLILPRLSSGSSCIGNDAPA